MPGPLPSDETCAEATLPAGAAEVETGPPVEPSAASPALLDAAAAEEGGDDPAATDSVAASGQAGPPVSAAAGTTAAPAAPEPAVGSADAGLQEEIRQLCRRWR